MSVIYHSLHYFSLTLIGLMEGKVTVNGELRLKHGIIGSVNITTTNEDSNFKTVQENISKLVTLAAGDAGLIHLRG